MFANYSELTELELVAAPVVRWLPGMVCSCLYLATVPAVVTLHHCCYLCDLTRGQENLHYRSPIMSCS